jgi:hypothetical protein
VAEIHGNGGSITFPSLTVNVKSWTLSWDADVHDITSFDDDTDRIFLGGLSGWTCTAECFHDATNTAAPGDSAEITLSVTAVIDYIGDVIMTNMSPSTPVDGIINVTYSFQGDGTLADSYV